MTILVKRNKKGQVEAVYRFSYSVDPSRYPGTVDETKEAKVKGIPPVHDFLVDKLKK